MSSTENQSESQNLSTWSSCPHEPPAAIGTKTDNDAEVLDTDASDESNDNDSENHTWPLQSTKRPFGSILTITALLTGLATGALTITRAYYACSQPTNTRSEKEITRGSDSEAGSAEEDGTQPTTTISVADKKEVTADSTAAVISEQLFRDPLSGHLFQDPWICSDGVIYEKDTLDYLVDTTSPDWGKSFQSVLQQTHNLNSNTNSAEARKKTNPNPHLYVNINQCVPAGLKTEACQAGASDSASGFADSGHWETYLHRQGIDMSSEAWGDMLINDHKAGKVIKQRRASKDEISRWRVPTPEEASSFLGDAQKGDFTAALKKANELPRVMFSRDDDVISGEGHTFVHMLLWHVAIYNPQAGVSRNGQQCTPGPSCTHTPSELVTLLLRLILDPDLGVAVRYCLQATARFPDLYDSKIFLGIAKPNDAIFVSWFNLWRPLNFLRKTLLKHVQTGIDLLSGTGNGPDSKNAKQLRVRHRSLEAMHESATWLERLEAPLEFVVPHYEKQIRFRRTSTDVMNPYWTGSVNLDSKIDSEKTDFEQAWSPLVKNAVFDVSKKTEIEKLYLRMLVNARVPNMMNDHFSPANLSDPAGLEKATEWTPLMFTCLGGNWVEAEKLLNIGANAKYLSEDRLSSLNLAKFNSRQEDSEDDTDVCRPKLLKYFMERNTSEESITEQLQLICEKILKKKEAPCPPHLLKLLGDNIDRQPIRNITPSQNPTASHRGSLGEEKDVRHDDCEPQGSGQTDTIDFSSGRLLHDDLFVDPITKRLFQDPFLCGDGLIYEKNTIDYLVDTTSPNHGRSFLSALSMLDSEGRPLSVASNCISSGTPLEYVDSEKCIPAGLIGVEVTFDNMWQKWNRNALAMSKSKEIPSSITSREWGDQLLRKNIRSSLGERQKKTGVSRWSTPSLDQKREFMTAASRGDFTKALELLDNAPRLLYTRMDNEYYGDKVGSQSESGADFIGLREDLTFVHWIVWHVATWKQGACTHSPTELLELVKNMFMDKDLALAVRWCMQQEGHFEELQDCPKTFPGHTLCVAEEMLCTCERKETPQGFLTDFTQKVEFGIYWLQNSAIQEIDNNYDIARKNQGVDLFEEGDFPLRSTENMQNSLGVLNRLSGLMKFVVPDRESLEHCRNLFGGQLSNDPAAVSRWLTEKKRKFDEAWMSTEFSVPDIDTDSQNLKTALWHTYTRYLANARINEKISCGSEDVTNTWTPLMEAFFVKDDVRWSAGETLLDMGANPLYRSGIDGLSPLMIQGFYSDSQKTPTDSVEITEKLRAYLVKRREERGFAETIEVDCPKKVKGLLHRKVQNL